MNSIISILFATIAAIGNALFALGQKKPVGVETDLLFVGFSAVIAVLLPLIFLTFGQIF